MPCSSQLTCSRKLGSWMSCFQLLSQSSRLGLRMVQQLSLNMPATWSCHLSADPISMEPARKMHRCASFTRPGAFISFMSTFPICFQLDLVRDAAPDRQVGLLTGYAGVQGGFIDYRRRGPIHPLVINLPGVGSRPVSVAIWRTVRKRKTAASPGYMGNPPSASLVHRPKRRDDRNIRSIEKCNSMAD